MTTPTLLVALFAITGLVPGLAYAQLAVTQPASVETIRPADDYATQAFQDPWDMDSRTDLGWRTFSQDMPFPNLTNISVSGGIFRCRTTSSDPNFWLLETGVPVAVRTGKLGSIYPIQTSKYRRLMLRMSLNGPGLTDATPGSMQFFWSNNTIYNGVNTSNAVFVRPGWWIQSVNLQTLGTANGVAWTSANADSFRVDPLSSANIDVAVDWARLVEDNPALYRNIQWTGSPSVDIFLDDDTNPSNGFLGQIGAPALTGGTFSFYVGGLPKGTYYVAVRSSGGSSYVYSPGRWEVLDTPRMIFTSPSPEGSDDDFATVQLHNPWDMDSFGDIDEAFNLTGPAITTIAAENEAGEALGPVRVYKGTSSTTATGDPYLYPFYNYKRGYSYRIDTNRYRLLTYEMGLPGKRDMNNGSIVRVVWKLETDTLENVSEDIVINHTSGANVLSKVTLDMKALPLEPGPPGSPAKTGWNGLVDRFRIDPHEFTPATDFWLRRVKLAAFERANANYDIRWNSWHANAGPVAMDLYWDNNESGFDGTLIQSGLDPAAGSFSWNTSSLSNGSYYLYSVLKSGATTLNRRYAAWPVIVDHAYQPQPGMLLGRSTLTFGATQNGAISTSEQEVTVDFAGGAMLDWTASSNRAFLTVTPTSGRGPGRFKVKLNSTALPSPASMDGTITVSAAGATNSPQYVRIFINVKNPATVAPPLGAFDTPTDGATGLVGSVAVTGWALHDVQISRVEIWRDKYGSESGDPPYGLKYIGEAMFVPDARPDVEAAYYGHPLAYRGGWGYLMLTYGLPNRGNGTFRLHAYAVPAYGNSKLLGTKTITVTNSTAVQPFGTLDTPNPGATVSGVDYQNWGWVLTPQPSMIPLNGTSVLVTIDSIPVGTLDLYNLYRADVSGSFPGYANTGGPVGRRLIDMRNYSNGMHNIGWLATDDHGHTEGIGSRFFFVFNGGTTAGVNHPPPLPGTLDGAQSGLRRSWVERTPPVVRENFTSVPLIRLGYSASNGLLEPELDEASREWIVRIGQAGQLQLHLPDLQPGRVWGGATRVAGNTRGLPPGSTLDTESGIFYWIPGPGVLGEFHLEFNQDGEPLRFKVIVEPQSTGESHRFDERILEPGLLGQTDVPGVTQHLADPLASPRRVQQ